MKTNVDQLLTDISESIEEEEKKLKLKEENISKILKVKLITNKPFFLTAEHFQLQIQAF